MGVVSNAKFLLLLNLIIFSIHVSSHKTSPPHLAKCPRNTLEFGACGDWLGLVHEAIGTSSPTKCCELIQGLAELEAAVCLCAAIKADMMGVVKLQAVPMALSLVVNACGKNLPQGFVCA